MTSFTASLAPQAPSALGREGHQLKAMLGALVFPRQRARWQTFIKDTPGMAALALEHPCLLYKIYRPYAQRGAGCAARVTLLQGHYRFLWQAGARPLVEYAARRALVLASVEGRDGALYRLQLTAIHDSHREGELCLRLTRDGVPLYLASFLFRPHRAGASVQLGALQGLRSNAGAQAVREATRALHGCRPKNLMVALLRDLGDFYGCRQLELVSNANRIALNGRRRRQISSDYDLAWEELHALPGSDGNYRLPCAPCQEPDLAAVPSKKRADARRRGAMLLALSATMRWQLSALRSAPAGGAACMPARCHAAVS